MARNLATQPSPLSGLCRRIGLSEAFRFAATDHTAAGERPTRFGDDRALAFRSAVLVEVDHHPIADAAELMSERGIREQSSEAPVAAFGVQDWQPGFARWVEAPGRDPRQSAAIGLLPILAIDVEEEIDPGARTPVGRVSSGCARAYQQA